MSDEKAENKPLEKPAKPNSQETPQASNPPEKPAEVKSVDLRESLANKAGDQGIFFNPTVGINTPDPFAPQDVLPSQPPSQTIVPTSPLANPSTSEPPASSSGSDSSGE